MINKRRLTLSWSYTIVGKIWWYIYLWYGEENRDSSLCFSIFSKKYKVRFLIGLFLKMNCELGDVDKVCVKLLFIIKIYILNLYFHFWPRAPKTLETSCDKRDKIFPYYVNKVTSRKHLRMERCCDYFLNFQKIQFCYLMTG